MSTAISRRRQNQYCSALPGRQKGALTMFSAVLILILLTEMILYAVQVGVFEQRKSANEMRQKEAFHLADAAVQFGKEFMVANANLISVGVDDVREDGSDGWLPPSSNPRWRPCADADLSALKGQHPCFGEPADNEDDFRADLRGEMYFYMSDPSGDPNDLSLAELPMGTAVTDALVGASEQVSLYALLCMFDLDRTVSPVVQGCTRTPPADPGNVQDGEQDYRYFMVTLLARAEVDCDGGTCTAKQLIADKIGSSGPGGGDGGPGAPLTTKSILPITSDTDIVPNPNGGGVGVPVSVWIDSDVYVDGGQGSWTTCEAHEFYEVDTMPADYTCPAPSGVCTCQGKKALSYPLPGSGLQHLGIDIVPDDSFPPDLFEYVFGKPGDAAGVDYVKALAEEKYPDCNDLDSSSFGIVWIEGSCEISSSRQIGSPGAPVFIVMAGTGNRITGSPNIYGTVMLTEVVNSPNSIDGAGNPTIYGAMIADGDISQFGGNLKLVYVEDILEMLLDTGAFGAVAGSWSDFHQDWL